jgi:membrane fusion protein (multidrug efflux system)
MHIKNKLIAAAIITSVFFISCSEGADESSSASYEPDGELRTLAVEGMAVTRSLLVNEIRGAGVAEGIREAWVVSETDGLIRDVNFSLGDRVSDGALLVKADDNLAVRNRDLASQQYETAYLEYQAAERSRESGSISQLQYSQVTDRLLAADAARAAALDNYENTVLRAPFAGAIASKDRSVGIGNYLARGIRVARIVDDSEFRTEISVGEGQVLLIQDGSDAGVTGNDGVTRSGTVAAVSAGSDGSTGSYSVVIEWIPDESDRLKSGMSVDVTIPIDGDGAHVIIPASAMRVRNGEKYVFVEKDGFAEAREITTGSRLGDRVEVLRGLDEGQTVLTSGMASLTPGIPVTVTLVGRSGDA